MESYEDVIAGWRGGGDGSMIRTHFLAVHATTHSQMMIFMFGFLSEKVIQYRFGVEIISFQTKIFSILLLP